MIWYTRTIPAYTAQFGRGRVVKDLSDIFNFIVLENILAEWKGIEIGGTGSLRIYIH